MSDSRAPGGSFYRDITELRSKLGILESGMASDRATMQAHLRSCDLRAQENNRKLDQLGEKLDSLQALWRQVQWWVIGGLICALSVVLAHDLLHIG